MIEPKAIWKLIEKHKSRSESERKEWDQYDSWFHSEFWDDAALQGSVPVSPTVSGIYGTTDDDLSTQTNYAYAFIDTMIANVCPSNPQITITARIEEKRELAQANEALINDTIRRNALHDILWNQASLTSICGRSFVRTVWSEVKKMPVVYTVDPRSFFYDMTVPWEYTRYVCEAVPITEAEWKKRLKPKGSAFKYNKNASDQVRPTGYPKWLKRNDTVAKFKESDAAKEHFQWVVIYEFYDLVGGKYYHFADDVEEPLLELDISKVFRFMKHPYTPIVFNKSHREFTGISDIKLVAPNIRRLNELDSLELWHIHTSSPIDYVNETNLEDPESFKAQISQGNAPNDIITAKVRDGVPMNQVIYSRPASNLSTAHGQMREQLKGVIEFTLGIPAYSRGKTGVAEVATELALADTATRTRNGRRIKILGDVVIDVAKKMGALWQEHIGERRFPVRSRADEVKSIIVDAQVLGYDPDTEMTMWDDEWSFDFDVVPFSPTENHRLVQLSKMQTFLPVLSQLPFVNQQRMVRKLLELLGMDEVYDENAAPQPPPGMASPGGQPGQPSAGPETLGTGGMPEGADFEDLSGVDARAMAQQPAGGG